MIYFYGQPVRFVENSLVEINTLTGFSVPDGNFVGYRTDYEDVEEIVDRKYWQPSTVAVSQVGKHPNQSQSMYDSSELLKNPSVSRLNATVRHPSNDIVDTTSSLNALRKITIEVAEADVKAQLAKAELERAQNNAKSVPDAPSVAPGSTIGG